MSQKHKKEDWMNSKWRPMMGWSYMITCIADFVIFPVLWSVLQAIQHGNVSSQWNPITLQGAGLYHLAMGAVLGVAAWSRGQEKIAGANLAPAIQQQNSYVPEMTTNRVVSTDNTKQGRPVVKPPKINSNPDSVLERN
jgi:hypothetical protein